MANGVELDSSGWPAAATTSERELIVQAVRKVLQDEGKQLTTMGLISAVKYALGSPLWDYRIAMVERAARYLDAERVWVVRK